MKKLSVILCAYNAEDFLKTAAKSVLDQTFKDLELIIVNDGSRDETLTIASQLATDDPRVTVVNIENGGLANARNVGLSKAKGEYVAFCDADDTLDTDCYQTMLKAVERDGSDLCISGYYHDTVLKDGTVSTVLFSEPDATYNTREELFKGLIGLKSKFIFDTCCNKLFKRSVIMGNNIQFPLGELFEDTAFVLSFLKISCKVTVLDRCFYHYMQRASGSITKAYNPRKLSDLKKRAVELKSFCETADSKVKAFCDLYYIKNVYSALANSFDDKNMSKSDRNALIKAEVTADEFVTCSKTASGVGLGGQLTVFVARKKGFYWHKLYCWSVHFMKTKMSSIFTKIK